MDAAIYDANRLASSRSRRQPEFPTTTQASFQSHRFCHTRFLLQFLDLFRSFRFGPFWLNSSLASRQNVWRYDRCGPVIGSSFVTHSSGSFSGLSDPDGTCGTTSSRSIKVRFAPAPSAGLALCGISIGHWQLRDDTAPRTEAECDLL